jgi:hypothetical protein
MGGRVAAAAAACALFLVLAGVGPCGPEVKELRAASQVRQYITDVIHGNAGEWDALAADASPQAKFAWEREQKIEALTRQLEQKAEWACEAADAASTFDEAYEVFEELTSEKREEIIEYFGSAATAEEIESVYDDVFELGPVEAALVTSELCP